MELALAVALAVVLFLAFSAFMARGIERERAQRLADELLALRRSAPVAPTPAAPAPAEEPRRDHERPAPPPPGALVDARERLGAALGEARRIAALPPAPARRVDATDRALSLARSLEAVVAGLAPAAGPEPGTEPPRLLIPPPAPVSSDAVTLATGELLHEMRHAASELHAAARQEERQREAASALAGTLARVERIATPLAALHGTLSGLADRVNLLALNVAVLGARPGPDAAVFQEAERELRTVYADLRRMGGELGALTQRSADALRSALEASAGIAERAAAATEARSLPADRLRRAEEKAQLLERAAREVDVAARSAEERDRLLARAVEAAGAEATSRREEIGRFEADRQRLVAESARAAALAGQLVEALGRAPGGAEPAPPPPPALGPLLAALEASATALALLDSPGESRTD